LPENEGPLPPELEQPPIPQNQKSIDRRRADRLAYYRSTTVEAYSKVGKRNPKWDDAAKDALAKLAIAKSNDDRYVDAAEAACVALEKAISLECDDPLIRYAHLQYRGMFPNPDAPPVQPEDIAATSLALRDSDYPAIRRAHAGHNYATALLAQPDKADAMKESRLVARKLLRQALAEDPRAAVDDFVKLANLRLELGAKTQEDRTSALRELLEDLGDGIRFDAVRHWLKGSFLIGEAWDARGNNFAHQVPEANMQRFLDKLDEAAEEFLTAWKLDSTRPEIAIGMMRVAGPVADHEALEEWFQRAMEADGDCVDACECKLNYLHPKWGGHSEAMRQFAKRLIETKNWHGSLPFFAVEIYRQLGFATTLSDDAVLARDWPVVEGMFEEFLKHNPDSLWGLTKYFKIAADAEQHEVVLRVGARMNGNSSRAIMQKWEISGKMAMAKNGLSAKK
jgi:hypothetical protein